MTRSLGSSSLALIPELIDTRKVSVVVGPSLVCRRARADDDELRFKGVAAWPADISMVVITLI